MQVNIDAALIQSGSASLSRIEDKVVALSNGCVCCTLREDLLVEMIALTKGRSFDYIVIESSGISEPMPVAEVFTFADEATGDRLDSYAYLDTCVTVVDARAFPLDYSSADSLADRATAAFPGAIACCDLHRQISTSVTYGGAPCGDTLQGLSRIRCRRQAQRRRLACRSG